MIHDKDLLFLKDCKSEDLQILVDYLTTDKDGSTRYTESLTPSEAYKKYYPHDLPKMWEEIVDELQHFGGNTFMNMLRGNGVPYREILCDVASKLKVNFNPKSPVDIIERNILSKLVMDSVEKLSEAELKEMIDELGIKNYDAGRSAMMMALQIAIKQSGFMAYKIAVIVANQVAKILLGRGLAFAANATLTRSIAIFAGPIGWIISVAWALIDIAGTAYRVTIPAVIQIAYMRLAIQNNGMKELAP